VVAARKWLPPVLRKKTRRKTKQKGSSRRARFGAGVCGAGAGADTAFSRGGSTGVAASGARKKKGKKFCFNPR